MRNELGDVRRSQVITSHGPGSLIDFRAGSHGGAGVSVVGAGLEEWDRWAPPPGVGNPQTIFEPRLQKAVGGQRLSFASRSAADRSGATLTKWPASWLAFGYPRWLQCPQLSSDWGDEALGRGSRGPGALLRFMHRQGRWAEPSSCGSCPVYCAL